MSWFGWNKKKDVDVFKEINPMIFSQEIPEVQDEVLEEIVDMSTLSLAEREKKIREAREPKNNLQRICADLPEELYVQANNKGITNLLENTDPRFASFKVGKYHDLEQYQSEWLYHFSLVNGTFMKINFPYKREPRKIVEFMKSTTNLEKTHTDFFFTGFVFPESKYSFTPTPTFLPLKINKDRKINGDWIVDPFVNILGPQRPTKKQYNKLIKAYSQEAIDEIYAPLNLDFIKKEDEVLHTGAK